ncbi:MAG TPA: lipoprotein-releasing ABC transporter permease subunit [bacterium]|nr:lipoprotein-releasing ABC transporter permease subunit [bacterium]
MKYPFEIFLGLRYLRSKRKRSAISILTWLSVAGVAIGVMALNVVLSVMNGFDDDLKSKIVGLNAHIILTGFQNEPISDFDHISDVIKTLPHVTSVGPYMEGQALARSHDRSLGVMVWGVDPENPKAVADLNRYLWDAKATILNPPATDGSGRSERILLGAQLARRLRVGIGDDIILFLPILQQTPLGMTPRSARFQVVGLFSTGMYDYDEAYTYISLDMGRKLYQFNDKVTGVAVKVDDVDRAPEVAKAIREKFSGRYFVQDWLQQNHNLFVALQTEKLVMGIILSLIVLVAALNIINPLTMMVIEKTREIGILKAMGASDKSIKTIFIFEGMFIGLLGLVVGLVGGFILCTLIAKIPIPMPGGGMVYYIDRLPVKVEPWVCYVIIPLMSVVLCFLSTLYPARQAAKLEPVEAIRYS